jgi:uncharacterized RDD family membrane protein YckC
MKISRVLPTSAGAGVALWLTLVLALPAQEPPPAPERAPAPEQAEPASPPSEPEGEGTQEAEVRRLGEPQPERSAGERPTGDQRPNDRGMHFSVEGHGGEIVRFGTDILLPGDQSASKVVALFGNIIADGPIADEAVAVMGDLTVNGRARKAVAVLGNVSINGPIHGQVVAVMGNVQLGPKAVVHGEIVCVGGRVDRAPGAVVHGPVQQIGPFPVVGDGLPGLRAWLQNCLLLLRPLAFDSRVAWAWGIAFVFLGLYLLIALLFNRQVIACAETLEQRPGLTVVTAILTALLAPVLTVLLAFIGVGFVLAPVLMLLGLFGKAAFLAWMGRRITEPLGWKHSIGPVFIGGIILLLLYTIPFAGFIVMKITSALGLGMVIYAVLVSVRRERVKVEPIVPGAPGTPSVPPTTPPSGGLSASPGFGSSASFVAPPVPTVSAPVETASEAPTAAAPPPPVPPSPVVPPAPSYAPPTPPTLPAPLQYSTLPRAGFWIRLAASLIDVVLVAVVLNMINVEDYFPPLFAAYCIVLWTLRGTTIGGIICSLKVVRVDERKIDWSIALVRGLGGFLSLAVLGLGFVWVVFDKDRQSWHDKIAGTTIVHVPRGVTLV